MEWGPTTEEEVENRNVETRALFLNVNSKRHRDRYGARLFYMFSFFAARERSKWGALLSGVES